MAAQLQGRRRARGRRGAVQTKELNLSFTRVTAPLAGRASYRRLAPGNIVTADTTPLTTIVTENPIRFVFDAPESALLKYKREADGGRASRVEIRLQDETDYRWKGRVDFLDNALDRGSGTIRLRAVVDNPNGFISPGMFGQLRLYASEPFDALLVPDQADRHRPGASGRVHRERRGRGRPEGRARPGNSSTACASCARASTPQDRIVISGVQRARPGRKVTVKESAVTAFPTGVSRGENSTLSMPGAASSPRSATSSATPSGGH